MARTSSDVGVQLKIRRVPMAMPNIQSRFPIAIVVIVVFILVAMNFYKTVPPGRVGVATLFGNVRLQPYSQGLHIPVNNLYIF